jgi:AcrR family transcriptional regulator
MVKELEDRFAAKARTPKGSTALRAIFRATYAAMTEKGLRDTSIEQIADEAGLTQAGLRHYFATWDELLTAFFFTATEWFAAELRPLLARAEWSARRKLEECVNRHLEFMEVVDSIFWLEGSAHWIRQRRHRHFREEWYRWLRQQYASLIRQMRPRLSQQECQRRAYVVLTLIVGGWITHGRSSAVDTGMSIRQRRQLLVNAAIGIVKS